MASPDTFLGTAEREQVDLVVSVLRELLADDLLGVYLHGSAVSSRLRPSSDVDLLVVTRQPPAAATVAALVERILPLSGSAVGRRPVEVTGIAVAAADVVAFQYGEWNRAEYESGRLPADPDDGDIVIVCAAAVQANAVVCGPRLDELLPPVDAPAVRAALASVIPALLDDLDSDTRNVLLTLARIAVTAHTGRIVAKDVAAEWTAEHVPEPATRVLRAAAEHYRTSPHWTGFAIEPVDARLTATQVLAVIDAGLIEDGATRTG